MMGTVEVSTVLTVFGILLLCAGLYESWQLRKSVQNLHKTLRPLGATSLEKTWDLLTALIGVFITGYVIFLFILMRPDDILDPRLLTSTVFLLGAIFVFVVTYSNRQAFSRF